MVTLNQADLLVHVGLELEIGWLPPLVHGLAQREDQPGQPGDLDCSQFIKLLDVPTTKVDRSQGDIHPMGNPHYWIPPVNAVRIAKGITRAAEAAAPGGRGVLRRAVPEFVAEMKTHVPAWEAAAKPLAGQKVVTYHKSWSYVSRWLKLDEIGYIENKPGIPPSPDHLAQLIVQMKAQGVKLIIVEDFYNRAIADELPPTAARTWSPRRAT